MPGAMPLANLASRRNSVDRISMRPAGRHFPADTKHDLQQSEDRCTAGSTLSNGMPCIFFFLFF